MTDTERTPIPLAASATQPLRGSFVAPGDKAISHRALILAALAVGRSRIDDLLEADDVLATMAALRQLGVSIAKQGDAYLVDGLGVRGLARSDSPLHLGNSGTGARLLMGVMAPYDFLTSFEGDATLARRPMEPLLKQLRRIGTSAVSEEGHLPVTLQGPAMPLPIHHVMVSPAEQIKSALLLAGLHSPGTTTIIEPVPTRDHTEKLLAAFGAEIATNIEPDGVATITLKGLPDLQPQQLTVPGDPSSAGYGIVAALIVPKSEVLVQNVLINPTRTGLIDTLLEMGGDIEFINQRETSGDIVADLRVRSSRMKGVAVNAQHAAAMLDDIPTLAVAAAFAQGETLIEGLAELREQECDRLAATLGGLRASGVDCALRGDTLVIAGTGSVAGGGAVSCFGDHRIAMSFLVLALGSQKGGSVDDSAPISASFPGFTTTLAALGAQFDPVSAEKGQS